MKRQRRHGRGPVRLSSVEEELQRFVGLNGGHESPDRLPPPIIKRQPVRPDSLASRKRKS